MTKQEAILLRDTYKPILINKLFDGKNGWDIKDVIVASQSTAGIVYEKMWQSQINNSNALIFYAIDDYDVFVISHQWPWGSGSLLTSKLSEYLKRNQIS